LFLLLDKSTKDIVATNMPRKLGGQKRVLPKVLPALTTNTHGEVAAPLLLPVKAEGLAVGPITIIAENGSTVSDSCQPLSTDTLSEYYGNEDNL
jgi:hypothetical protein